MSATQWVECDGAGFWAFDVALALFLEALIAAAREHGSREPWLRGAIEDWTLTKTVNDHGLTLRTSSSDEKETLVALIERACDLLSEREVLTPAEVAARGGVPRGTEDVDVRHVIELGRAVAELVRGSLAPSPAGTEWLFGAPGGRTTIRMRA